MLNKLFESLDEKVFTDELKAELSEQFNTAATAKAEELNQTFISEYEIKSTEVLAEKVEEKIVELEEKAEEFKSMLEAQAEERERELLDQVDAYLEKVVEDFINESKVSLEESIKAEKSDMIIEAMDAMLVATGTDIAKIVEAKDSADAELQLGESKEKYDNLVEANIALEKEISKLMRMGIIAEMQEGLSAVQADKFERLANLVDFNQSEEYVNKLDTIKESITSNSGNEIKENVEEIQKPIVESKESKETKKESLTTSFSHLI